jgi:hypothetical protein
MDTINASHLLQDLFGFLLHSFKAQPDDHDASNPNSFEDSSSDGPVCCVIGDCTHQESPCVCNLQSITIIQGDGIFRIDS